MRTVIWDEHKRKFLCSLCNHDEFVQRVTADNAVVVFTNDVGRLVESDDYIGSWEVVGHGPLQCGKCKAIADWTWADDDCGK